MPAALADYFFIAGLEGNEADILGLRPPSSVGHATLASEQHSPRPGSSPRDSGFRDGPSIHETILEEPSSTSRPSITVDTVSVSPTLSATKCTNLESPNYRPPSSSTFDSRYSPLGAIGSVSDRSFDHIHVQSSEDNAFEQEIAKFTSERDHFLSSLASPTISVPATLPFRRSIFLEHGLDGGGHVPEIIVENSHMDARASSTLRPRSSLRSKIADLSRRASSRTGANVRRASTICVHP